MGEDKNPRRTSSTMIALGKRVKVEASHLKEPIFGVVHEYYSNDRGAWFGVKPDGEEHVSFYWHEYVSEA